MKKSQKSQKVIKKINKMKPKKNEENGNLGGFCTCYTFNERHTFYIITLRQAVLEMATARY